MLKSEIPAPNPRNQDRENRQNRIAFVKAFLASDAEAKEITAAPGETDAHAYHGVYRAVWSSANYYFRCYVIMRNGKGYIVRREK